MWKIIRLITIGMMLPLIILTWLPSNRVPMDGTSYVWGLPLLGMGLSGNSMNFDWLIVVLVTLLAFCTLWTLMRGTARSFGLLGSLYFGQFFASAVLMVARSEEPLILYGDTLGFELQLGPILIGYTGMTLLLALIFLFCQKRPDLRSIMPPGAVWTRWNRRSVAMAVAIWFISGVLLRFGTHLSLLDQIGVFLLISYVPLLTVAFTRRDKSRA